MKSVLRWVRRILVGAVVLVLVAVTVVYGLAELQLRRTYTTYEASASVLDIPTDAAAIEEGVRLARIRGCYDGCHGAGFSGEVFLDEEFPFDLLLGRMTAPDLTRLAADRSDASLERSIRHGVNPDQQTVLIMPSDMFQTLADEDVARIIGAIRAEPITSGPDPARRLGPLVRYFLLTGVFSQAAANIDHATAPPERAPADPRELGRYLAMTVCTECHGLDLQGHPSVLGNPAIPALSIAASYPAEDFVRLMREGVATGDRELGLMSDVALSRFVHFTDSEASALYLYLTDPATWGVGATQ